MKETLNGILARHTGQPLEKIATDSDRDFFMDSEAAMRYGIIDSTIKHR